MKLIYRMLFLLLLVSSSNTYSRDFVPNEVQMPGTQPNEVGNFESPDKCDNCHAGFNSQDPGAEPATGWRGAAMGNAGRDPVFWATLGIVEQDFDGAGDLCIRCHSARGWYGGRSTPTDGSGLAASDDNGIDCDTCHASTDTDNTGVNPDTGGSLAGVMNPPFLACVNNGTDCTGEGYYGSGMLSLWPQVNEKLGPFKDAAARHQWQQSAWHRDPDFCGTCHDVSNPVVGDLAPNNGTQDGAPPVVAHGIPELAPDVNPARAAFNNPPYAYGIVERTFSEYKSGAFPTTRVADITDPNDPDFGKSYLNLPDDLKATGGSIDVTRKAAAQAGTGGDYADGTSRYFSCQSCHMRPVGTDNGGPFPGCNKNGAPLRADLPRHDHTGGNYWFANMTQHQDNKGTLRLGGGLSTTQIQALGLGQQRAVEHLQQAASLVFDPTNTNRLKVINLTGHKLITGYPEGRRMWLNIKWYNGTQLVREDGAYGPLVDDAGNPVMIPNPLAESGQPTMVQVESILDLEDPNTKVYEAHYAMTKEWAATLTSLTDAARNRLYPDDFPLSFDRYTGAVDYTLGELAAQDPGTFHETFHFALNNYVAKDNRIPPYGMRYDEAKKRNALPVPFAQYGISSPTPAPGSTYNYWDLIDLDILKPDNGIVVTHATIDLLYQGTSWEYIQFLDKANNKQNAFLGQEGVNMLDAWINAEVPVAMTVAGDRKMVPPVVMASTIWYADGPVNTPPVCSIDTPAGDTTISVGDSIDYAGTATDSDGTISSYSWTFEGGSPATSGVEDPGPVSYSNEGIYTTTFSATDNGGASCTPSTVMVTVTGTATDCGIYTDTKACRNEPTDTCRWDNRAGMCVPK